MAASDSAISVVNGYSYLDILLINTIFVNIFHVWMLIKMHLYSWLFNLCSWWSYTVALNCTFTPVICEFSVYIEMQSLCFSLMMLCVLFLVREYLNFYIKQVLQLVLCKNKHYWLFKLSTLTQSTWTYIWIYPWDLLKVWTTKLILSQLKFSAHVIIVLSSTKQQTKFNLILILLRQTVNSKALFCSS